MAAAAYRDGARYRDDRTQAWQDYTGKEGVVASGGTIPCSSGAEWALDPETLWNAAEAAERRKDSRTARELEIALPNELSPEQSRALVERFCQVLADRNGTAVRWAIHDPERGEGNRNCHVHILETVRVVTPSGLGERAAFAMSDTDRKKRGLGPAREDVQWIREAWAAAANEALAKAGFEERVDHRSHKARGFTVRPTQHQGPKATAMKRRGEAPDRQRLEDDEPAMNAEAIRANPAHVLEIVTRERAVFTRRDVARVIHRYLGEDHEEFLSLLEVVMASPELVELVPGDASEAPRLSTRRMIRVEVAMIADAAALDGQAAARVMEAEVAGAAARLDAAVKAKGGAGITDEQLIALEYILKDTGRLAMVEGLAGTGKSTLMGAAAGVWRRTGGRVFGAALSGQAADSLQSGSGIESRTLASWELSWSKDRDLLRAGDTFVVDEAGMVGSEQLGRVLKRARVAGAKVVMIHDREQAQAIAAGAAARAVHDELGGVRLDNIVRQQKGWQRLASVKLGTGRSGEGLAAYQEHGRIEALPTAADVRAAMVRDLLHVVGKFPGKTACVMAHSRREAQAISETAREARRQCGELQGEVVFQVEAGARAFAVGDQLMFRRNSNVLGVRNGTIGRVESVAERRIVVRVGKRVIEFDPREYVHFDHGYAATVHKKQGATADFSLGRVTPGMDRHLVNVMGTRHRVDCKFYYATEDFADFGTMAQAVGRANLKASTLDYIRAYAERRGLVPESEIVLDAEQRQERAARARFEQGSSEFEIAREAGAPKQASAEMDEVARILAAVAARARTARQQRERQAAERGKAPPGQQTTPETPGDDFGLG